MRTIKVVLKEPENGVDTFIIYRVFKFGVMYDFRRDGFEDIPVGATLRIEDYDKAVWKFDLDMIKSWEVEE